MLSNNRLISRALIPTVATASLALGALLGTAPASAHVRVDADDAVSGESAILTFRVPNESEAGPPTPGLSIALPNLTSVSTAVIPGWTAHGRQPEHSPPTLVLTAGAPHNGARGLAGAALLVAALGTAAALVRRRA